MDLEDDGDEAVIDIGAHVTNIVVHAAGATRFVRILPSGGRDITMAIARGLGVDEPLAERLKRGEEVELPPAGDQDAAGPDGSSADDAGDHGARPDVIASDPARVRDLAMQRAASFVDEIRSSLEFYTAQAQDARIARILVTGGGSKLDGFLDLIRQRIPVEVETRPSVPDVPRPSLHLSPEALAEAEPLLAVAVGLAIPGRRHVSHVNLLPPEILEAQRWRRVTFGVAVAGGDLAGRAVRVLPAPDQHPQRGERRHRGSGAHERLHPGFDRRQAAVRRPAGGGAIQAGHCCATAYAGEVSFSSLLMDLSRVVPSDAYIDSLTVQLTAAQADVATAASELVGAITDVRQGRQRRLGRDLLDPGGAESKAG